MEGDGILLPGILFGVDGYLLCPAGNVPGHPGSKCTQLSYYKYFMESKLPPERFSLEISLAARKLSNHDLFSKSDPFCIVAYELEGEPQMRLGETEVIENNLNPNWEHTFSIDYHEELV